MTDTKRCPDCDDGECTDCDGSGFHSCAAWGCDGSRECPTCGGTGRCDTCNGEGQVPLTDADREPSGQLVVPLEPGRIP